MPTYRIDLEYHGAAYRGWQSQKNAVAAVVSAAGAAGAAGASKQQQQQQQGKGKGKQAPGALGAKSSTVGPGGVRGKALKAVVKGKGAAAAGGGKKGKLVVISPGVLGGRNTDGPEALEVLRKRLALLG